MNTEHIPSIELGYREGSSDKVYRACVEAAGGGFMVNFAYGRRGSPLAAGTNTQVPVSYDEVVGIYEKLVRSKLAKGYTPTGMASTGIGMNLAEGRKDTGLRAMLLNPITEEEAERYLQDPAWCAQEKFDGKRILVRKTSSGVEAANRHGLATGFPTSVADRLMGVEGDFVIDGELVGDRFYAFDILENMGHDWRPYAYHYRLISLKALLEELEFGPVSVVETYRDDQKSAAVAGLRAENKEGQDATIIERHKRSVLPHYEGGRGYQPTPPPGAPPNSSPPPASRAIPPPRPTSAASASSPWNSAPSWRNSAPSPPTWPCRT